MPIIQVNMFEGRTEEQKRRIAEGITEVMVKEAQAKEESVRIIFNDIKRENFAIGKKLAKDM